MPGEKRPFTLPNIAVLPQVVFVRPLLSPIIEFWNRTENNDFCARRCLVLDAEVDLVSQLDVRVGELVLATVSDWFG